MFHGNGIARLISIEFSQYSEFFSDTEGLSWAQALITADGLKNAPNLYGLNQLFWVLTVLVGLMVLLPSQMSIIDDVCRRWTDIIWSGVSGVREKMSLGSGRKNLLSHYDRLHCLVAHYANGVPVLFRMPKGWY